MISLSVALFLVIVYFFQRNFVVQQERKYFFLFLFIKLSCATLVGVLYTYYYDYAGDSFTLFEYSRNWYKALQDHQISFFQWLGYGQESTGILPKEPRTRFFAYIISFLMPLSGSNYYMTAFWLSLFQLCILWRLSQELIFSFSMSRFTVYVSFFLVPSLTFWSSGILKETFMLALMAMIVFNYLRLFKQDKKNTILHGITLLIAAFLLYKVKYYVAILFLPLGFAAILFNHFTFKSKSLKKGLIAYFLLVGGGVALMAILHPVFNSGLFFELLKISYDNIALKSQDALILFNERGTYFQFVLHNLPWAMFTAFFRPFVWESWNLFSMLLSFEIGLFTISFMLATYLSVKIKLNHQQKWWCISAIIYLLAIGSIITLTTPNFGTLARYRVAYMPIAWFIVLWVINKGFSVRKL